MTRDEEGDVGCLLVVPRCVFLLDVIVPSTRRITFGELTFPVAAARTWNDLSSSVWVASSLQLFLWELKTALFSSSSDDQE